MGSDYEKVLGRIPLFADLDEAEVRTIAGLVATRRFKTKETVVRQQDPGGELFVILEGHTKVVTSDADGRDTALDIMGPGEVFGEVTLLDGAPRSATVIALAPCQMLVLRREPFVAFLESHPKAAIRLIEVIARRLRRLTQRADDIAFLNVSARLARRIVRLADEHGRGEGDGVRVSIRLSQQEIGDLICATRESANKHIRNWEQQGIVSQRSGYLIVHDLEALRTLGNGMPSDHNMVAPTEPLNLEPPVAGVPPVSPSN